MCCSRWWSLIEFKVFGKGIGEIVVILRCFALARSAEASRDRDAARNIFEVLQRQARVASKRRRENP